MVSMHIKTKRGAAEMSRKRKSGKEYQKERILMACEKQREREKARNE